MNVEGSVDEERGEEAEEAEEEMLVVPIRGRFTKARRLGGLFLDGGSPPAAIKLSSLGFSRCVPGEGGDGWAVGTRSGNGVGDGYRTRDLLSHSQAFYP
jgi:hypothetical protein